MTERHAAKRKTKNPPQWVGFTVLVSITFMLALAINFRAYTAMSREAAQHDSLNKQIENLTSENLALQDEIHAIKSDPKAIEREAKKIGLSRPE
jgi:cell division protein FtsB